VRSIPKYTHLSRLNVSLTLIDLDWPSEKLSDVFSKYDIIVSATGFATSPGTVTKLAQEVLQAGRLRLSSGTTGSPDASVSKASKIWFFPWQWGADYDVTLDGHGLMPLFGEQKAVRDLLRKEASDAGVKWTVVSTGIFMSFLFEQFWGVIDRSGEGKAGDGVGDGRVTVRALGSWDHGVVVTDVSDIGKVLARILEGALESEDKVLYVAGDSVTYAQLADTVSRVTGKEVHREEWSTEYLEEELSKDPENQIKKYRVVFSRPGVFWSKEGTVNQRLEIKTLDVETYARDVLRE
jgi:hypothetical protein